MATKDRQQRLMTITGDKWQSQSTTFHCTAPIVTTMTNDIALHSTPLHPLQRLREPAASTMAHSTRGVFYCVALLMWNSYETHTARMFPVQRVHSFIHSLYVCHYSPLCKQTRR